MTPAEKIAAAITRLEQFTDPAAEEWAIRLGKTTDVIIAGTSVPVASNLFSWNADEIVTLHRTLDAQLAILRNSAAFRIGGDYTHELALADAILGEPT
jgi:hypothetical protein